MYQLILKEVFKPIKGYEDLYEISNLGRVKSLPKKVGRRMRKETFLKSRVSAQGYEMVTLCRNYKSFNASVHRLVAEAFIPNTENKATVNHIDGNPLNNDISNLEWATQSENNLHAYRTGLKDPKTCGRHGKRRHLTDAEKAYISIKTKEAMQREDVQKKLHATRKKVQ